MRKLALAMLITGVCLFPLNTQADYNLAEYFPLDQDNRWVYSVKKEGAEEASEKKKVLIEGVEIVDGTETIKMFTSLERAGMENDEGYFCVQMGYEGIKVYKYMGDESYTIYKPALLILPTRLEVGKEVEYYNSLKEYSHDGATSLSAKNVRTFILEGFEDVTIKSGKFANCLKLFIEEDANFSNGEFEITRWKIWFAPNVGKVKEIRASKNFVANGNVLIDTYESELESAVIGGEKIGE